MRAQARSERALNDSNTSVEAATSFEAETLAYVVKQIHKELIKSIEVETIFF